MTKPTGRPRGRPRKDAVERPEISAESESWQSLPWRRVYDIIDADMSDEDQERMLDQVDDEQFLNFITSQNPKINPRAKIQMNPLTLRTLAALGKLFCTQQEVAGYLGVSRGALQNFFDREPYAREVFENGLQHAKISLRRKQLALADKNAPAAIFLGKNYLGQRDEHHNTTTNVSVSKLSDAELEEMARAEAAKAKAQTKQFHS
jgi:hypothetical protein